MRSLALVAFLLVSGCKSSEKSSAPAAPEPSTAAAPVPDEAAQPEVKDEAPDAPANALTVGNPVKKPWDQGGPGEVSWKVEGGYVTLKAEAGKPEGVLFAIYQNKQQHVTNFPCAASGATSEAGFALTQEGKVVFRSAAAPAGKVPGRAQVFLLEWKPDKGTVFVADAWMGTDVAEPPAWARP